MNKLIHELAQQAGDYVNSVYKPPVRSKTPGKIWEDGHVDWHTQFNEKYAEILLFECIKLAVFKGDTATAKAIKEHFGVEE
jgi:hypothetical protein